MGEKTAAPQPKHVWNRSQALSRGLATVGQGTGQGRDVVTPDEDEVLKG